MYTTCTWRWRPEVNSYISSSSTHHLVFEGGPLSSPNWSSLFLRLAAVTRRTPQDPPLSPTWLSFDMDATEPGAHACPAEALPIKPSLHSPLIIWQRLMKMFLSCLNRFWGNCKTFMQWVPFIQRCSKLHSYFIKVTTEHFPLSHVLNVTELWTERGENKTICWALSHS